MATLVFSALIARGETDVREMIVSVDSALRSGRLEDRADGQEQRGRGCARRYDADLHRLVSSGLHVCGAGGGDCE